MMIAKAAKIDIEVIGIHCHIGLIFDLNLVKTARINFIADIRDKLNIQLNELNLGGVWNKIYRKDAI